MSFKVGDVVVLKSGGPEMTVIDLNWNKQTGRIRCRWHSAKDEDYKVKVFREEALKFSGIGPRAKAV